MSLEAINSKVAAAAEQLKVVPTSMSEAEAERERACSGLRQALSHLKQAQALIADVSPACANMLDALTTGELCVQTAQGLLEEVAEDETISPTITDLQGGCEALQSDFIRASDGLPWEAGLPIDTLQRLGTIIETYESDLLPSLTASKSPIDIIGKLTIGLHATAAQHLNANS